MSFEPGEPEQDSIYASELAVNDTFILISEMQVNYYDPTVAGSWRKLSTWYDVRRKDSFKGIQTGNTLICEFIEYEGVFVGISDSAPVIKI